MPLQKISMCYTGMQCVHAIYLSASARTSLDSAACIEFDASDANISKIVVWNIDVVLHVFVQAECDHEKKYYYLIVFKVTFFDSLVYIATMDYL